jgi:hypothetical protein
MRLTLAAVACATLAITAVAAEARQARDPFERGTMEVEFGASAQVETWNLNERRETLVEGSAAMWGTIGRGFSLGVVFDHLRIFQRTPGAFVQGVSPLVRWRFLRRDSWHAFVEAGPGFSWSDLETPPRGTKFNYLFQTSVGVRRRVGSYGHASFGARFLHLSNHGREGLDRNPDLEMIGPFASFSIMF